MFAAFACGQAGRSKTQPGFFYTSNNGIVRPCLSEDQLVFMDEKCEQVGSGVLQEVLESMWQEDDTKVAKRLNLLHVIEVAGG